MKLDQRSVLIRATKIFAVILLAAIIYVSVDFIVDLRPSEIHSSYRFTLDNMPYDQPLWLHQDNLAILLIKRSVTTIEELQQENKNLQDQFSEKSRQPDSANNILRSRYPEFFISYGNGTDLGCKLEQKTQSLLGEICGDAQYDFAGRALIGKNSFQNLSIPDYNFSDNFKTLIIRP